MQQWASGSDTGADTAPQANDTRLEVFIEDIRYKHIGNVIPDNVFFVATTVRASQSGEQGNVVAGLRTPDYPWTARLPPRDPVVREGTTYFQNPIESPPKDHTPWSFESFVEKHLEGVENLKEAGHKTVADRIYAHDLILCEIPPEYVTETRAGRRRADIEAMHRDGAEVSVGRFGPRSQGISSEEVAEKIGRVLPGNVTKPRQLKEIRRVHMTDIGDGDRTRRCAYYTENDHKHNNCSYSDAPETIIVSDTDLESNAGGHTGGDAVRYFFPELGKAIGGAEGLSPDETGSSAPKFLAACRFRGHNEADDKFIEESVEVL